MYFCTGMSGLGSAVPHVSAGAVRWEKKGHAELERKIHFWKGCVYLPLFIFLRLWIHRFDLSFAAVQPMFGLFKLTLC